MKIEFDETDKKNIENINKDLANNKDIPLFINETDKSYFLKFKATDIAKADIFIAYFMNQNNTKELNDLGINIEGIMYSECDGEKGNLKTFLKEMLSRLENM